MEYSYPIDLEWTNEEMMQVVAFLMPLSNTTNQKLRASFC